MGWELGYREGGLRMKQKVHIYEAFLFQRKVNTLWGVPLGFQAERHLL